ncbi:MBL fold metallo-hydrolase [Arthrobacter zhaoguopingii]|uniref:MBL fold metallo-hydrolase n=1 Tax=Arthrobacter zhaoguopingii TaxID=2681491 RepID=UPI00135BCB99|nr:MBL fold metallo-hydrolase [Arthrobacter zhaoguopingii]
MLTPNVADGIHRIAHAHTNCYLVEDGGGLLLVDAGLPGTRQKFIGALSSLGRSLADVRAVVLTHGHFDHLGFAEYLRLQHQIPVYGHVDDAYIASHPYRYQRERTPLLYPVRYPQAVPVLARMAAAGALKVRGVKKLEPLTSASAAALPGNPVLVPSPGHTLGHCALSFPERGVLISGDALVTLDPYTGRRGPQIVARAATADTAAALTSLDALEGTGAQIVLPGHGYAWTNGVAKATAEARLVGGH